MFLGFKGHTWAETIEKLKKDYQVSSHERSTFFKKGPHFGQNSRPGESDPYVSGTVILDSRNPSTSKKCSWWDNSFLVCVTMLITLKSQLCSQNHCWLACKYLVNINEATQPEILCAWAFCFVIAWLKVCQVLKSNARFGASTANTRRHVQI